MLERPCSELFDPAKEECTAGDHESARPQLDQLCEGYIEVTFGADIESLKIQSKRVSRCLQLPRDGLRESGIGRIDQQRHDTSRGDQLMQQFQPLLRYLHISLGDPRDVAAWTVKTRNEAKPDRVATHFEDDRNGRGRRLRHKRRRNSGRGNHRDLTANEIGGHIRKPFRVSLSPAKFYCYVLAFNVAGFFQTWRNAATMRA